MWHRLNQAELNDNAYKNKINKIFRSMMDELSKLVESEMNSGNYVGALDSTLCSLEVKPERICTCGYSLQTVEREKNVPSENGELSAQGHGALMVWFQSVRRQCHS